MIICSINTRTAEVKLTSLMRDMAVEFTDLGSNNGTYRLNAANYFGGPELTMKTINELLGKNIEKYVMVNFTGFTQICEALGGIEMDITESEMNEINNNAYNQFQIAKENGWMRATSPAPTNTSTNTARTCTSTAVRRRPTPAFVRSTATWERTNRQRKVLVAMMEKMRGTNAMQLLQLGMTLQQYIETNMTLEEIIGTADKVLNSGLDGAETMVVPVTDTYVQETRNNQSMFYDVDWVTNAREVQKLLRRKPAVPAAGFLCPHIRRARRPECSRFFRTFNAFDRQTFVDKSVCNVYHGFVIVNVRIQEGSLCAK